MGALVRDRSRFLNRLRIDRDRGVARPLLRLAPLQVGAHRRRQLGPPRSRSVLWIRFPFFSHRSKPTCVHDGGVASPAPPKAAIAQWQSAPLVRVRSIVQSYLAAPFFQALAGKRRLEPSHLLPALRSYGLRKPTQAVPIRQTKSPEESPAAGLRRPTELPWQPKRASWSNRPPSS